MATNGEEKDMQIQGHRYKAVRHMTPSEQLSQAYSQHHALWQELRIAYVAEDWDTYADLMNKSMCLQDKIMKLCKQIGVAAKLN